MSVAQSFGISVPASIAARMIEVPAGTVTGVPSIVRVTLSEASAAGVPKSGSWIRGMAYSAAVGSGLGVPKSSGKWVSALRTG